MHAEYIMGTIYKEPDPDLELYVMIEDAEYMLSIFAKHNE